MDIDGEEADQPVLGLAHENGRVHDRVVEMLSLHRRVIAQQDVAVMQAVEAEYGDAITHCHAHRIGDEGRHAASVLREQLPAGAGDADGKIIIFVDIGTEGGALDVGVNLVGD